MIRKFLASNTRLFTIIALMILVPIGIVLHELDAQTVAQNVFGATYTVNRTGSQPNSSTGDLDCGGTRTCLAGVYQVSGRMGITVPNLSGSVSMVVTAHDGYNSQSITLMGPLNTGALGSANGTAIVETAGTGKMTYALTVSPVNGSPSMYWTVAVKRIR